MDNIIFYSDYSFFNTLLIDYQYPDFLDLGTKNKFSKNGFEVLENAKKISILSANNDIYVKIRNGNENEIKLLTDLTKEEIKKYNDRNDNSIILHHKEFKGLSILDLYDCKDTNMDLKDYKHLELPALFNFNYNDIYNSFVKALYSDGYKIKYCDNLDTKFEYDKNNRIINIKNGLSAQMKILSILEVYSNETTNNIFEKNLLKYSICKGIGINNDFDEKYSFVDWYNNTDFLSAEKTLKLVASKSRKFINNFNKFFSIESKNFEYEYVSLYDDYKLTI